MRRALTVFGVVLVMGLVLIWALGGLDGLSARVAVAQREFQQSLAGALRRLRAGEPGTFWALMGICFTYGFVHAAGPGHGKLLIGGYGLSGRARPLPMFIIALGSSLAQATVAVALVYGGILILGWGRERLVGLGEAVMAPLSYAAVGLIGLWLVKRGLAGFLRQRRARAHGHDDDDDDDGHGHRHDHGHGHDHGADGHCESCGHRHGPSAEEVARLRGPLEALALIAGIAMRPCTGALFLLIITWRMDLAAEGILGAYAMGLGTASVTLAVAALSLWARAGTLAALERSRSVALVLPALELGAGLLVALVAGQLLLRSL